MADRKRGRKKFGGGTDWRVSSTAGNTAKRGGRIVYIESDRARR